MAQLSRRRPVLHNLCSLFVACGLVGSAGCASELVSRDYGDPTSLSVETEESGLYAWVLEPRVTDKLETAAPEFVIGAYSKQTPHVPLRVLVGRLEKDANGIDQAVDMQLASTEGEPGPNQRFKLQVPLTHGENRLLIRVETEDQQRVRRMVYALNYRGDAPGLRLSLHTPSEATRDSKTPCSETVPLREALTAQDMVCVLGRTTTAGSSKTRVSLGLAGAASTEIKLDEQGAFVHAVSLQSDRDNVLEARVTDDEDRTTDAKVVVIQDSQPPKLTITSNSRETTAASLEVEGTAKDQNGVAAIEVHGQDGSIIKVTGGVSPFKALVRLAQGENTFDVVARDRAGNEARQALVLSRLRTLWLGPEKRNSGSTVLDMDRFALEELFDEQAQKDLSVVQVDLKPAIRQSLQRIREPERFGVDTTNWGTAERNLQRILNMTPDNADLSGTSMEELIDVANAVGLPSPRLLSDLLQVGITDFIVHPDVAADVLTEKLIGTHPNIVRDDAGAYVIDVSLYDVLHNLSTLAGRFSASGGHPGFLTGTSYSEVLEPGFMLSLPVQSNLVQYDAVDLSRASKDFFFLLDGERVLDFNVLEDEFSVVGLKDEPTVDLRIQIAEHPGASMLLAGTSQTAAPDPDNPGFYRGNSQGYGVSPWFFEHSTIEIGYRMLSKLAPETNYKRTLRYDAGSIKDAAVINWDRGWVNITVAGGVAPTPPPMYAWDLLMEVAQVRLHDNGVPEGQADMAFTLDNLSVGLTADELVERLRPRLAEQETELSELFVGDMGLAKSNADIFYAAKPGEVGALMFRAPNDSEEDYPYTTPGFFSDPELTDKVSTTDEVGGIDDPEHEKVPATLGATYYVSDEASDVFAVTVAERDGDRIGLRVVQVARAAGVTQ